MAEWLNAAVLKTVRLERVSGVRIPPPPFFARRARKLQHMRTNRTQNAKSLTVKRLFISDLPSVAFG